MSKKIHTTKGVNFRPQLGEPFLKLCRALLKHRIILKQKNNAWTETDAARFLLARGWQAVSEQEIPEDVKKLLKPYYKDEK